MKLLLVAAISSAILLLPSSAQACMSDSDCAFDKVCECRSSRPTGNCDAPGRCVMRKSALTTKDAENLQTLIQSWASQKAVSDKKLFGCHTKCELVGNGLRCEIKC